MNTHDSSLFCPAKLNLFLGVLGPRKDGYHDLLSLVAPIDFGDTLYFHPKHEDPDSIQCNLPTVPQGPENLCLKALALFRKTTGKPTQPLHLRIEKKIPPGSGLGGGSSNAAGVLLWLNEHEEAGLAPEQLHAMALELGSDVPLFLKKSPQLLKGRGETLEPLAARWTQALSTRSVLLFLPGVHVATPEAFHALKAQRAYMAPCSAPEQLERYLGTILLNEGPPVDLAQFNSFQALVFKSHPKLQELDAWAQSTFHRPLQMSGSGSACFMIEPRICTHPLPRPPVGQLIRARFVGPPAGREPISKTSDRKRF